MGKAQRAHQTVRVGTLRFARPAKILLFRIV
jgi:hypothetical protein